MKVLVVSSNGGHFNQIRFALGLLRDEQVTLVSFDTVDVRAVIEADFPGLPVVWAHHPTNRNVRNLFRNFLLAWGVVRRQQPDLVLSPGAGVAVPFIILGHFLGSRTAFIEVFDRVDSKTLTGRMVAPFCDYILLQHASQLKLYPTGIVVGGLLWSSSLSVPIDKRWTG